MKITATPRKPRNPFVAPAHFRRAGVHQACGGSLRQRSGRALRRELEQLTRTKYSPRKHRGATPALPVEETIMTSLKPLPWSPVEARAPWTHPARRAVAASLHAMSTVLVSLAQRLAVPAAPVPAKPLPPVLEFYADAGAPEGALYMDGKLVGWVPGVKRL